MLLLLIFFVVQHIQIRKVYIIKLLKIYLFSASTISMLGIIEFLFPSFMSSLFDYQVENQSSNIIIFNRLAFLFLGLASCGKPDSTCISNFIIVKVRKSPHYQKQLFSNLFGYSQSFCYIFVRQQDLLADIDNISCYDDFSIQRLFITLRENIYGNGNSSFCDLYLFSAGAGSLCIHFQGIDGPDRYPLRFQWGCEIKNG